MTAFEQQGLHVSSSEPFREWCGTNGIDLSVSTVLDDQESHIRTSWNKVLLSANMNESNEALEDLLTLEQRGIG